MSHAQKTKNNPLLIFPRLSSYQKIGTAVDLPFPYADTIGWTSFEEIFAPPGLSSVFGRIARQYPNLTPANTPPSEHAVYIEAHISDEVINSVFGIAGAVKTIESEEFHAAVRTHVHQQAVQVLRRNPGLAPNQLKIWDDFHF